MLNAFKQRFNAFRALQQQPSRGFRVPFDILIGWCWKDYDLWLPEQTTHEPRSKSSWPMLCFWKSHPRYRLHHTGEHKCKDRRFSVTLFQLCCSAKGIGILIAPGRASKGSRCWIHEDCASASSIYKHAWSHLSSMPSLKLPKKDGRKTDKKVNVVFFQ